MKKGTITGAAILAGGKSKRFGGINKALFEIEGKSILDRTLEVLEKIFDEIIIITNKPDDFRAYKRFLIKRDIYQNSGPLGGIHAALFHTVTDALFVVSCDMPFLDGHFIRSMLTSYQVKVPDILLPQTVTSIEPLHAIYNKRIIKVVENVLQTRKNPPVRTIFEHLDVDFFSVENNRENQRIFSNINSVTDLPGNY